MAESAEKEKEGKKEKKKEEDVISQKLDAKLNNVSRRLRIIEERYSSLREQIRFTDQSFLKSKQKFGAEIRAADDELGELSSQISEMSTKINDLLKELSLCAKEEDLRVIQKYIEIWEPVEFVTRKEVSDMIKQLRRKV
jgi:chromosome segregation ATPase